MAVRRRRHPLTSTRESGIAVRHVFILGRWDDAQLRDVQSVIRDWSAVGLVLPSVWIDLGRSDRDGTVIDRGVAEDVELLSWIPRHEGQIRLFSLQVLTTGWAALDQATVQSAMDDLRLPPGTPLVNLLAPVDGLTGLPDSAVFDRRSTCWCSRSTRRGRGHLRNR